MNCPTHKSVSEECLPLCSLTLMTYNQASFVREALRAALAQTYPHLEIVISDDASTDQTWDIIQEEIAKYTGPHQIVLNRNEKNMGFGAHMSKLFGMMKGRILILGAGDDISSPDRVQKTYEAFRQRGEETMLIWCNHEPIDEHGQSHGPYKNFDRDAQRLPHSLDELDAKKCRKGWWPFGALIAMRREVLDFFGGMPSLFSAEDTLLSFRALLLGRMEHMDEVLLQYRSHPASISNAKQLPDIRDEYRKRMKGDCARIQSYAQALVDINYMKRLYPERIPFYLKIEEMLLAASKRQLVSCQIMSSFPHLSFRTLWKALPYPGFHRHFFYALLYKMGFYRGPAKG